MADGIGTRIARRRQQLRMTQEELAARLGVAKSTVANWETGKHFPLRHLGAVEEVLGIRLSGEPEPQIPPRLRQDIIDFLGERRAAAVLANMESYLRGEPPPGTTGPGGGQREARAAAS